MGAWFLLAATTAPAGNAAPQAAPTETLVSLLELVIEADADSARECLEVLSEKVRSGELSGQQLEQLQPRLQEMLGPILKGPATHPLHFDAHVLAASWGHPASGKLLHAVLNDPKQNDARRLRALTTLVSAGDPGVLGDVERLLARSAIDSASEPEPDSDADTDSDAFRAAMLAALGDLPDPRVATIVLEHYGRLDAELQPKAIELLTQRTGWSKQLLTAIGEDKVPAEALNRNQVAQLLASRDTELAELVRAKWGTLRTERNPQREMVIAQMRELLGQSTGDPRQGKRVFQRVCGQCHRIYGEGQQVGPDITSNGRGSYDQLLSNVFDPSLVIGSAYQARSVITVDGRVLTGLVAEDNQQRMVLKLQGGKTESIPRGEIDEVATSRLSLMPEGLERQLKPQELVDLFAFLVIDGPPENPDSHLIRGAPSGLVSER